MPFSSGSSAYRRLTDPILVPVTTGTGSTVDVPADYIPETAESFEVTNSNSCWVRLKGFKAGQTGAVEEGKGWLFPPGFKGVFSTQRPHRMSAMAVARPGFPIPSELVPLELTYGNGQ